MRRRHPARLLVVRHRRRRRSPLVGELRLRGTAREIALGPLGRRGGGRGVRARRGAPPRRLAARAGGNPLFMRHLVDRRGHGRHGGRARDAARRRCTRGWRRWRTPHARGCSARPPSTGSSSPPRPSRPRSSAQSAPSAAPGSCESRGTRANGRTGRAPRRSRSCTRCTATCCSRRSRPRAAPSCTAASASASRPPSACASRGRAADRAAPPRRAAGRQPRCASCGSRPASASRAAPTARRIGAPRSARCSGRRGAARRARRAARRGRAAVRARAGARRRRRLVVAARRSTASSAPARSAEALGDREPLASVLLALATLHEVRGEPAPALEAIGAGEELGDHDVEGAELLACALFHQGAFTRALVARRPRRGARSRRTATAGHYDDVPGDARRQRRRRLPRLGGAVAVVPRPRRSEALRRARRALELSEDPARAYSAAAARAQMAALHACRGEPEEALRWAQATIDAARERGYAYRVAMGRVLRGWALAAGGRADGVAGDRRAAARRRARPARASRTRSTSACSPTRTCAPATRTRASRPSRRRSAIAERERAHYYDAELHRLRGELLLAAGGRARAGRGGDPRGARRRPRSRARARSSCAPRWRWHAAARAPRRRAAAGERRSSRWRTRTRRRAAPPVALLAGRLGTPGGRSAGASRCSPGRSTGSASSPSRLEPERLPECRRRLPRRRRARPSSASGGHVATEDESGGPAVLRLSAALENGPQRAVRTGRALAEALRTALDGVPLRAVRRRRHRPGGRRPGRRHAAGDGPDAADRLAPRRRRAARRGAGQRRDARGCASGDFEFAPHGAGPRRAPARPARRAEELAPLRRARARARAAGGPLGAGRARGWARRCS